MSNCKAKERCKHLPESRGEWLIYCDQCVHDSMTIGGPECKKDNLNPYSVDELIAQLSASQASEAALRERLADREAAFEARTIDFNSAYNANIAYAEQVRELKQRAEAAEARIKASQEQEPVVKVGDSIAFLKSTINLYAQPPIPPELAELQRDKETAMRLVTKTIAENEFVKRENTELKADLTAMTNCAKAHDEGRTKYLLENTELRKLLESKVQVGVEKDAERYRFIRNQAGPPSPEEFDSAVDADMAQQKEPKQ